MPIQLPNLDDRRFPDLVDDARASIQGYAPEWTHHNPSDPGITLIEVLASLSEMLIYRLNRITALNVISYLKLLNGADWNPFELTLAKLSSAERAEVSARIQALPSAELARLVADQVPRTVLRLRQLDRAVSPGDFEALALQADSSVARARCLPRRNLDSDLERDRPGHVSVIILPKDGAAVPVSTLIASVESYLSPRLLLTTELHVIGAVFLSVQLRITLVRFADELAPALAERVVATIRDFYDPQPRAGRPGWPFGRDLFLSDLYGLLDATSGVDYVESITLVPARPERLNSNDAGELIGVLVKPYELLDIQIAPDDLTILTSVAP